MPVKHCLVTLDIRNGECEYTSRSTHPVARGAELHAIADKHASEFYGGPAESGDGGYYFHGGTVHVQVDSVKPVTKADLAVLRKFNI
jgi:hypothetical protein